MAIAYMSVKNFGRANGTRGSVATSAAAYRSGERIRDERTGAVYDHSRRRDVMHKEILLPEQYQRAGAELDWARDRSQLWNAAELAEHQRNSRVAREYVVALPHELKAEQQLVLAQTLARTLSERYGNAVDLAVHAPRTDPRNFHAHLLTTTRQITLQGFGAKTTIEWSGTRRHAHGLPRFDLEYRELRQTWFGMANEALREAGLQQRIQLPDLRAQRSQDRVWLPRIAYEIEKRGAHSYLGDLVRRQFQEREWSARQPQEQLSPENTRARDPDAVAAAAVRDWMAYRERQRQGLEPAIQQQGCTHDRGRDDDHGL